MQKLLAKFRQTQSATDALKLLAYLDKHPFAVCLTLDSDEHAIIEGLRAVRARALTHKKAA